MEEQTTQPAAKAPVAAEQPDVVQQLRDALKQSREKRLEYVAGWQLNVDARRGKDFDTAADEGRVAIPIDHSITKAKAGQLFSQMPQVRFTPKQQEFATAVPVYAKAINDVLDDAGLESVVNECVVDCINAAGVAAAIVRYEALTEQIQVPALDAMQAQQAQEAAAITGEQFAMPMRDSVRVTDRRFCIDRISPGDFLWPTNFRVSNWSKAPWLGHSGRCSWPEGVRMFGLTDEQKSAVVGAGVGMGDRNRLNVAEQQHRRAGDSDVVAYDELFYWRHIYHSDETSYTAIQRVVFVAGIDEPVINEAWKGQQVDQENGGYLGSCRLPIQVLTLAYISDEAIPPSDSAIIRPQVKELQEARQHMKDQRKHSRPLRWFDVDRVDPTITADLIKGTWQGMIPTIGSGDKVIGEVARTAYPRENLEFDRILKADIQEAVSVGPNQSGSFASGERSASEANIVQQSFQTEIGQQRARVASFVVGIAEVVAGLYALYGDVTTLGQQDAQRLASWDRTRINQKFVLDVRPDSTVRVDAQQLVDQLKGVLNVTAQSGFINPKPLIQRIIELNGLDPAEVMVDPTPKGPEPPKITFSFKGEDLLNPVPLSVMMKAGMAPTPEELAGAIRLLQSARLMVAQAPPDATQTPGGGPPQGELQTPDKAFPQWEASSRVNTRRSEG